MTPRTRTIAALALVLASVCFANAAGEHKPQFKFTAVDITGSQRHDAFGVNDFGVIAGTFVDENGFRHGYKMFHDKFEMVDHPEGIQGTVCLGINLLGAIVGWYQDASGVRKAGVYHHGKFVDIVPPDAVDFSAAFSIND